MFRFVNEVLTKTYKGRATTIRVGDRKMDIKRRCKLVKNMWKDKMDKKGLSLREAPQLVMMIVVSIIILGAGSLALSGFQGSLTSGSTAYNATSEGTQALGNLSSQFPVIGTIAGVAILISIVIGAFMFGRNRL